MKRGAGLVAVLGLAVLLSFVVASCGEDEAAQQQEIQAERAEAARIARQGERIRQLERDLEERRSTATDAERPDPPTPIDDSAPPPTGSSDSWPSGVVGWTVILGSSPTSSAAEEIAASAVGAGLPQVGVLFSSNYSSLNDGYWVTYTGVLNSESEAEIHQGQARASGFTDAYAREVAE